MSLCSAGYDLQHWELLDAAIAATQAIEASARLLGRGPSLCVEASLEMLTSFDLSASPNPDLLQHPKSHLLSAKGGYRRDSASHLGELADGGSLET